jgi:hypothetical protein
VLAKGSVATHAGRRQAPVRPPLNRRRARPAWRRGRRRPEPAARLAHRPQAQRDRGIPRLTDEVPSRP